MYRRRCPKTRKREVRKRKTARPPHGMVRISRQSKKALRERWAVGTHALSRTKQPPRHQRAEENAREI